MDHTLHVGCAQIAHTPDAPDRLRAAHLQAFDHAQAQSLDLLVFPECSLTGYPDSAAFTRQAAIRADGPELTELAAACGPITAVVGFIEDADGQYFNSMAWIAQGTLRAVHRKVNLPNYGRLREAEFFTAGDTVAPLPLGGDWIGGGLICADFWDPGLVYLAALQGTTVMALPIASTLQAVGDGFSNPEGWHLACASAAMMYRLPILRCNWTGPYEDMTFWGGSAIYDASGQTLATAGADPTLIHAPLSARDLAHQRAMLPTVRDLRPEVLSAGIANLHAV